MTLIVQQEQLPAAKTSYPLPKKYWARPIEGQNTDWFAISSNWLGSPYIEVAGDTYSAQGSFQPDGIAPNSPHVMWSKSIQDGGVVGGTSYHTNGTTYCMGGSYQIRFQNALIMYGVDPVAPTPTQQPVAVLPPTEMYITAATIAIIAAIAIVGILLLLALRKRQ
jgi:hypothetical protein